MTFKLPRIAVVIPCYNSADWIGRTISSVLDQGYPDLVLIVADDGSTDGSAEVVRGFGERVILQSGPNRGACHARNRGTNIAAEKGATYVLYLDSDDWFEGPMLSGAGKVAAETGADIVLSNNHIQLEDGKRIERFAFTGKVMPKDFFEGWMTGRHFAPVSVLMKIAFVQRTGGWDESLSRAQDTEFFLRCMFYDPLIMMNEEGAAIYNLETPGSVSKNVSPRSTDARIRVLTNLLQRMPGTDFEPLMPLLQNRLYKISREAFRMKQIEQGRKGVQALRDLGFRKHLGSRGHRVVANLIGLEAKVRLWGN